MAGKIFINYRREDSIGTAGRLHDRLAQTFGRKNLFMDVDHIPAGVDFVNYLNSQVAACDVFLAIIGPNWLDAKDESGRRRFDNPEDFVTIEIAAALNRKIRVIPVLVDGARTPKADNLPASVKPLVRRNAVEMRNTHFGRDAEALVNKVREALKSTRPVTGRLAAWLMAPGQWWTLAGGATALLLVGWIGLYRMGLPVWMPWEQPDMRYENIEAELQRVKEEIQRQAKAATDAEAKLKIAEADQQSVKEEEQRQARAAADAEAKRKAAEAEQQRQPQVAAGAEAKRQAGDQQRLQEEVQLQAKAAADAEARRQAAEVELQRLKEEVQRQAKAAADAEAKRKAAEAEQQRLAAVKAEEERKAKAGVERMASIDLQWKQIFAKDGKTYRAPVLIPYQGVIDADCGGAQSTMGPFYCPLDQKLYLDTSFLDQIGTRFLGCDTDSKSCQVVQAYVIAHEVGHHVQNLLGILPKAQQAQRAANSRPAANHIQVQIELQADCLAGVWANLENQYLRSQGRQPFIEPGDVEVALRTAAAIGEDMLERKAQGHVVPDSFTHGSAEQRLRWFNNGFQSGSVASCNTFAAAQL
jgi:uncharacterized protein